MVGYNIGIRIEFLIWTLINFKNFNLKYLLIRICLKSKNCRRLIIYLFYGVLIRLKNFIG